MLAGIAEDLSAIHSKARHFLKVDKPLCATKDLGTGPCPRRSGCYQRFSSPFWNEPPQMDVSGHNHTVDSEKSESQKGSPELNFRPCVFGTVKFEILTCFWGGIQSQPTSPKVLGSRGIEDVRTRSWKGPWVGTQNTVHSTCLVDQGQDEDVDNKRHCRTSKNLSCWKLKSHTNTLH